jgi:regulatory protein
MTTISTQKITAIEPSKRVPDHWHISLDGAYAFTLGGGAVVAERLSIGQELSAAEVTRLRATAEEGRVMDAALRFLAARPRSRAEVRRRLLQPRPKRQPIAPELAERVLDRLDQMGLLNDEQFAEYWAEQRERFSPRAAYAITQELRQRGVDAATAAGAADPEDDAARALAAGRQRLRALRGADEQTFRVKLGQFLLRRGFSYGIAREATRTLWEETTGTRPSDDEGDDATSNPAE